MYRAALFWGVCIPVRTAIAIKAGQESKRSERRLTDVRALAVLPTVYWLSGQGGSTGFFGGDAWWAEQRALHGTLWGLYVYTGRSEWLWLDVGVGAMNWFIHN